MYETCIKCGSRYTFSETTFPVKSFDLKGNLRGHYCFVCVNKPWRYRSRYNKLLIKGTNVLDWEQVTEYCAECGKNFVKNSPTHKTCSGCKIKRKKRLDKKAKEKRKNERKIRNMHK